MASDSQETFIDDLRVIKDELDGDSASIYVAKILLICNHSMCCRSLKLRAVVGRSNLDDMFVGQPGVTLHEDQDHEASMISHPRCILALDRLHEFKYVNTNANDGDGTAQGF